MSEYFKPKDIVCMYNGDSTSDVIEGQVIGYSKTAKRKLEVLINGETHLIASNKLWSKKTTSQSPVIKGIKLSLYHVVTYHTCNTY